MRPHLSAQRRYQYRPCCSETRVRFGGRRRRLRQWRVTAGCSRERLVHSRVISRSPTIRRERILCIERKPSTTALRRRKVWPPARSGSAVSKKRAPRSLWQFFVSEPRAVATGSSRYPETIVSVYIKEAWWVPVAIARSSDALYVGIVGR